MSLSGTTNAILLCFKVNLKTYNGKVKTDSQHVKIDMMSENQFDLYSIFKLTMARAKPTANMLTRWLASPILKKLVLPETCSSVQYEHMIQYENSTI